jgi:hypothetical protein
VSFGKNVKREKEKKRENVKVTERKTKDKGEN